MNLGLILLQFAGAFLCIWGANKGLSRYKAYVRRRDWIRKARGE